MVIKCKDLKETNLVKQLQSVCIALVALRQFMIISTNEIRLLRSLGLCLLELGYLNEVTLGLLPRGPS